MSATVVDGVGFVAATLADASPRQVTAALYLSPDHRPGDDRQAFELVELWAAIGLHDLTPDDVDRVHSDRSDRARLAACRAAALAILAAR
ncbi:hypothetical protein GCM10022243_63600 [Saccharothrix violaceirubra]|uniref:hypothetical protein n=1 Tax=Saccharothrix violaceirubra TaxID=413306 RepID=UPI0031EB2336